MMERLFDAPLRARNKSGLSIEFALAFIPEERMTYETLALM